MSEPRRPLEEVGVIRGITVELDVDVPMRDGVTLRANVFRPPSGRSPTLLTRLPYSKDGRWSRDVLEPVAAAARSYSVVVQDTRGCDGSGLLSTPPPPIDYGSVAVPALLVGPWTHLDRYDPIGELAYGLSSEIDWIDLSESFADIQLAWFGHWLKGIDNGVMSEPPVRIFVMGRNAWRDEDDWPPPRAVMALAYLRTGGRLEPEPPRTEPPDGFNARPSEPVPTLGGATMLAPSLRAGPFDLVARLLDVGPDGRAINLTDSISRISGSTNAVGQIAEWVIDLGATSNLFRAGHRIGLHVTWGSFPRWLPASPDDGASVPGTVTYEIFHDSEHLSRLEVLVIGEDSVLALVPRS